MARTEVQWTVRVRQRRSVHLGIRCTAHCPVERSRAIVQKQGCVRGMRFGASGLEKAVAYGLGGNEGFHALLARLAPPHLLRTADDRGCKSRHMRIVSACSRAEWHCAVRRSHVRATGFALSFTTVGGCPSDRARSTANSGSQRNRARACQVGCMVSTGIILSLVARHVVAGGRARLSTRLHGHLRAGTPSDGTAIA